MIIHDFLSVAAKNPKGPIYPKDHEVHKALKKGELILWGMPKGKTDPLHENILATKCKTVDHVRKVCDAAHKDGWHSFRVAGLDLNEKPDFTKTLNR